jgi:hypothetical protein
MENLIDDFRSLLDQASARLAALSDQESERRRTPGTWSTKEILGHLIDSAANNHQRFVRGQVDASLALPGYGQDDWVRTQGYHDESWPALVRLWTSYNGHLVHVMSRVPETALGNRCTIGGETVTLEFLMVDYVRHIRHHLRQIFGDDV